MTDRCELLPDDPREIKKAAEFIARLRDSVSVESNRALNEALRSRIESEAAIASFAYGSAVNSAGR